MNKTIRLILKILGFLLILALIVVFVVLNFKGETTYWKWVIGLPTPWNIVLITGSILIVIAVCAFWWMQLLHKSRK